MKLTDREKAERLQTIRCFVLDMDGTIYLGEKLFDFTREFLDTVEAAGKTFCFFTNNSSKNEEFSNHSNVRMKILFKW